GCVFGLQRYTDQDKRTVSDWSRGTGEDREIYVYPAVYGGAGVAGASAGAAGGGKGRAASERFRKTDHYGGAEVYSEGCIEDDAGRRGAGAASADRLCGFSDS